MQRNRTEHGQGTPEYVGVAIVAAILVGAIVMSVLNTDVGGAVERAVCQVTSLAGGSGGCEQNSEAPDTFDAADQNADGASDQSGADPTGQDMPADPGPACVPVGSQPDGDGVPVGSVTVGTPGQQGPLRTESSVTVGTGAPTVDENGREWQDVSVSVRHQASLNGEQNLPKDVAVAASAFTGTSSDYKVTVPPSLVGEVADGDVPNPLDPLAMAEGVGVTISSEFYAGHQVEATYRQLKAGFNYAAGTKISTAVQRLPGDRIRVLSGPSDVIRQAVSLGIGTENLSAALVASREFEDYRLEQVDFDLGRPEGRTAYYRMLMVGAVPGGSEPGVVDRSTLEGFKGGAKNGFELKAGQLTAGLDLNSSDYDVSVQRHANGDETLSVASRINNHKRVITRTTDADGNSKSSSHTLLLRDVHEATIDGFNQAYGQLSSEDSSVDGPQNVVMRFDDDDFAQWQQEAHEIVAHQVGQLPFLVDEEFGGEPPTSEDIAAWVEDHPVDELYQLRGVGGSASEMAIRVLEASKYPDNIASSTFIAMTNQYHQDTLLHDLTMWQIAVADARGVNPTDVEAGAGSTLCRGTA